MRHKLREAGLGDDVDVESAGTGGWHVGHPPGRAGDAPPPRARGIALESRAQRFEADALRRLRPDRGDGPPEPRGHARARAARRRRGQARTCSASTTRSPSRPATSRSPTPTTAATTASRTSSTWSSAPATGCSRRSASARPSGERRALLAAAGPGARRRGRAGDAGSAAATSTRPGRWSSRAATPRLPEVARRTRPTTSSAPRRPGCAGSASPAACRSPRCWRWSTRATTRGLVLEWIEPGRLGGAGRRSSAAGWRSIHAAGADAFDALPPGSPRRALRFGGVEVPVDAGARSSGRGLLRGAARARSPPRRARRAAGSRATAARAVEARASTRLDDLAGPRRAARPHPRRPLERQRPRRRRRPPLADRPRRARRAPRDGPGDARPLRHGLGGARSRAYEEVWPLADGLRGAPRRSGSSSRCSSTRSSSAAPTAPRSSGPPRRTPERGPRCRRGALTDAELERARRSTGLDARARAVRQRVGRRLGVIRRDGVIASLSPATPDRSIFNSVYATDPAALEAALDELEAAYEAAGVRAWTRLAARRTSARPRAARAARLRPRRLAALDGARAAATSGRRRARCPTGVELLGGRHPARSARSTTAAYGLGAGAWAAAHEPRRPSVPIAAGWSRSGDGEPVACAGAIDAGDDAVHHRRRDRARAPGQRPRRPPDPRAARPRPSGAAPAPASPAGEQGRRARLRAARLRATSATSTSGRDAALTARCRSGALHTRRVDLSDSTPCSPSAASPPSAPGRSGSGPPRGARSYAEMTNLPAGAARVARGGAAALDAELEREVTSPGRHPQGAVRDRRRAAARDGADELPRRPPLALPLEPVGLPADLQLLRDRPDGVRAQPDRLGDPRPGAPLPPQRRRSTTPSSWGWASR